MTLNFTLRNNKDPLAHKVQKNMSLNEKFDCWNQQLSFHWNLLEKNL